MLVDEKYVAPKTPASVIAVGDAFEALLIRSMLESLGAAVLLHLVGTPEDFLLTLERKEHDPKLVVICGHGDENGLVFGDYGDGVDVGALVDGSLPAAAIAKRARMPGAIVVSTACLSGDAAFAKAFLEAGAAAYIAPADCPDASDAALFVHYLLHSLLRRGLSPERAFDRARHADPALDMFRLHKP
ncbi:hypothetical protein A1351_05740 [Methylosinus sp. R-45379]|nr:hypothetical protein A1351_05740 [Methylosinus sp. R-45379]